MTDKDHPGRATARAEDRMAATPGDRPQNSQRPAGTRAVGASGGNDVRSSSPQAATRDTGSNRQEQEQRGNANAGAGSGGRLSAHRRPKRAASRNGLMLAEPHKLDWAKFTHFRARNTLDDLRKLVGPDERRRKLAFDGIQPDSTGLWPIHWAAINNRPDMIEFMLANGAQVAKRSQNRLLANGTPLHLAAMNGSLEAAAALLDRGQEAQLLKNCDLEGQSALMRSAAPRSRRLDAIRELLGKNFWSLGARPAEMALYLISRGADYHLREPHNGMNLMHLAIVNDYDDIVSLLMALNGQLVELEALRLPANDALPAAEAAQAGTLQRVRAVGGISAAPLSEEEEFSAAGRRGSHSGHSANEERPLICDRERARELVARGIKPLQLAILYGRVSIIGLLWRVRSAALADSDGNRPRASESVAECARAAHREQAIASRRELRRVLWRATWSNRAELAKFLKSALLKTALALDLGLLLLVWAPIYASDARGHLLLGLRGGFFLLALCLTLAISFRVMLKNPGYLRRNSVQYLTELARLTGARGQPPAQVPLIKLTPTLAEKTSTSEPMRVERTLDEDNTKKQRESLMMATELAGAPRPDSRESVRLLCHKCQCIRRPRTRHCNYCDHCVLDFDHHCVYLGCCIGRHNRLDFLLTNLVLALAAIYGSAIHASSHRPSDRSNFWNLLGFVWVFKYVLVGAYNSYQSLRRACLGVTMYEELRSQRIRRLFGRMGPPKSLSKSHRDFDVLKGSHWRYAPNRFVTGDLSVAQIITNLKEFSNNYASLSEYLLTYVCADTPLVKSLNNNNNNNDNYNNGSSSSASILSNNPLLMSNK